MPQLLQPGFLMNSAARAAVEAEVGGGGGGFSTNAVNFDGTNDWLSKAAALSGAGDNINLLFSLWFRLDAGTDDAANFFFWNNVSRLWIARLSSNKLKVHIASITSGALWDWESALVFTTLLNTGWNHLLVSAQLAATPLTHKYINDTIEVGTDTLEPAAGTIDWSQGTWGVGADNSGTLKLNEDFAEFYLTNEFLDLSVEANRRKFIDASGKPVDLGADGSTPTGTAPLIYLSGATDAWHTNKGSGAGFAENGAITDAATSPSD